MGKSQSNFIIITIIITIFWAVFTPFSRLPALQLAILIYLSYMAAIAIFKPKTGLFLIILTRPCLDIFTNEQILAISGLGPINIASLLAIIVLILAIILLFKNFGKITQLPLKKSWSVFLLFALISCFFSIGFSVSITEWFRLLSIFSLFVISFLLTETENDFSKLAAAIAFSAVIPVGFSFYQFFTATGISLPFEGIYNRIYGTFAHPNLFAYYLLIPIIALFFLFFKADKKFPRIQLFALLPLCIIALVLTYTRGAWLAFLIIIFIVGIFKYRKFLIVSAAIVIISYFLFEPIQARVLNLFSGQYSSIDWRLGLWQDSVNFAKTKPLLGYGTGTAKDLILEKRGYQFGSSDPHNDYLKILLENGLLGLIAYLTLINLLSIKLFNNYLKLQNSSLKSLSLIILSLTVSLYIMSFSDNIIRNTALQWAYWSILGSYFAIVIPAKVKMTN